LQRMYLRDGQLYTVTDDVPGEAASPSHPPPTSVTSLSDGLLHLFVALLLAVGGVRVARKRG
jgi:hypothetical protein